MHTLPWGCKRPINKKMYKQASNGIIQGLCLDCHGIFMTFPGRQHINNLDPDPFPGTIPKGWLDLLALCSPTLAQTCGTPPRVRHIPSKFPRHPGLQSRLPVTGVLDVEISRMFSEKCSKENGVLWGVLSRVLSELEGAPRSAPVRAQCGA